MSDRYPVRWAGRRAVVMLPQHVGESNAGQIRELLLLVINRGATELIVDMTGTAWCDQAGAATVARAQLRAAASGTQLRLVVTAEAVRRMLTLHGLDRLIPVYPSVEAATATGALVVPMTPKPGGPHVPRPRKQAEPS
jgi:anti-sigma B factor antagonist